MLLKLILVFYTSDYVFKSSYNNYDDYKQKLFPLFKIDGLVIYLLFFLDFMHGVLVSVLITV